MTRQIAIVVGVALLSAAGFGAILGIGWLVSHFVLGVSSDILASRLNGMPGVLPVLCALAAFIGAACAASKLAQTRARDAMNEPQPVPKPR
jgi:hypothetical protein